MRRTFHWTWYSIIIFISFIFQADITVADSNSEWSDRLEARQRRILGSGYQYNKYLRDMYNHEQMERRNEIENFSNIKQRGTRSIEAPVKLKKKSSGHDTAINAAQVINEDSGLGEAIKFDIGDESYYITMSNGEYIVIRDKGDGTFDKVDFELFHEKYRQNMIEYYDVDGDGVVDRDKDALALAAIVHHYKQDDYYFTRGGSLFIRNKWRAGFLNNRDSILGDGLVDIEKWKNEMLDYFNEKFETGVLRNPMDSIEKYMTTYLLIGINNDRFDILSTSTYMRSNYRIFSDDIEKVYSELDRLKRFATYQRRFRAEYIGEKDINDQFDSYKTVRTHASSSVDTDSEKRRYRLYDIFAKRSYHKEEKAFMPLHDSLDESYVSPRGLQTMMALPSAFWKAVKGINKSFVPAKRLKSNLKKSKDAGKDMKGRDMKVTSESMVEECYELVDIENDELYLDRETLNGIEDMAEHIKMVAQKKELAEKVDFEALTKNFNWLRGAREDLLKDYKAQTLEQYLEIAAVLKVDVDKKNFRKLMVAVDRRLKILKETDRRLTVEEEEALEMDREELAPKRNEYINELNSAVRYFIRTTNDILGEAVKAVYRSSQAKSESLVKVGGNMLD